MPTIDTLIYQNNLVIQEIILVVEVTQVNEVTVRIFENVLNRVDAFVDCFVEISIVVIVDLVWEKLEEN